MVNVTLAHSELNRAGGVGLAGVLGADGHQDTLDARVAQLDVLLGRQEVACFIAVASSTGPTGRLLMGIRSMRDSTTEARAMLPVPTATWAMWPSSGRACVLELL